MTRTRLAPLALGAALTLVVPACSDEEPTTQSSTGPASVTAESGDVDRYCTLTEDMNALGKEIFADVPEDATAEQVMALQQQLVDRGAAILEEMEEVAPEEIREDVAVFNDDLRARAATGQSADEEAAAAAEESSRAFADEHCPGGADGS